MNAKVKAEPWWAMHCRRSQWVACSRRPWWATALPQQQAGRGTWGGKLLSSAIVHPKDWELEQRWGKSPTAADAGQEIVGKSRVLFFRAFKVGNGCCPGTRMLKMSGQGGGRWFAEWPYGSDGCNRSFWPAVVETVKWSQNLPTIVYRLSGLFLCKCA